MLKKGSVVLTGPFFLCFLYFFLSSAYTERQNVKDLLIKVK